MARLSKYLTTSIAAICLASCSPETPTETADIILSNGVIYTADKTHSTAEAIAIKGNHIMAVGTTADIEKLAGPNTTTENLHGKMVMPGLHDMHIHALGIVSPDMCDLDAQPYSLDDLVPFIQDCIVKYNIPEGEAVGVLQWNPFEGNKPTEKYPTLRAALDAASSKHKVFLYGNDGHHGAANSMALSAITPPLNAQTLANEYKEYADLVPVDAAGEPSGGLNEGAKSLVGAGFGLEDSIGEYSEHMPKVAHMLASRGLTSIQEAKADKGVLAAYKWLDDNTNMTFRVRTALFYSLQNGHTAEDLANVPKMIDYIKDLRASTEGSHYIRANATKLFADGVMEGNPHAHPPSMPVAAMLEPYNQPIFSENEETGALDIIGYVNTDSDTCRKVQDTPAAYSDSKIQKTFEEANGYLPKQCLVWSGTLEHSEELIKTYIKSATDAGFHVHVHAIAEKAIHVATEAFEEAKASADKQGLTQSLAHVQIAADEDLKRLGKLGVYAAYTYHWIKPTPQYEMTVIPFTDKVDGIDDLYNPIHSYMQRAYAVKTAMNYGVIPVFGSDAPVESRDPRPFKSMQQALTREGDDGVVLNPAEKLNIHEAIASYTINSAGLMARADELGSLEAGKLADLIVIDRNIVDLAESGKETEIGGTKVLKTIMDGRVVFEAE
ncbi:amidohydrolase [Kordiimonas pumila]|uniref:Amidohydrolase n=1 Tax=Kordiimonas pumila TaxID=2161677 RepID=A0ABV7D996_9PROT|nr:amidohydrolase family protein [Kordiimonas pumila]